MNCCQKQHRDEEDDAGDDQTCDTVVNLQTSEHFFGSQDEVEMNEFWDSVVNRRVAEQMKGSDGREKRE